jgi:type 1 glutamine amidotransferase
MARGSSTARLALAAGAAALLASASGLVIAQQAPPAAPAGAQAGRGGGGGRGGAVATALFGASDANKDGSVSRDEWKATFQKWADGAGGSLTQEQLATGLAASLPQPAAPAAPAQQGPQCGGRSSDPHSVCPEDVAAMKATLATLSDKPPAKPLKARKILVLGKTAGFNHSSIPLAAVTMDELGKKTGAWTSTLTYDAADINTQNLKQYDAIVLDSTTGAFLDDANDPAATAARRAALLDFVRGGKGLVGIHAATDSYHANAGAAARAGGAPGAGGPGAPGARGGFGGGRGGAAATLAPLMVTQGDKNADQKLSREEITALADAWFDKMDTAKAGSVAQADFATRFAAVMPAPAPGGNAQQVPQGRDNQVGTWPEFNKMIGGFFKFHWVDPQEITYKIDDPKSPLTAMFKGAPFVVHDETYTMGMETYSRENLHILTSVDYSKMTDEDKAKESNPRSDHDYALSWIKREGNGRVFYMAHGHHERNYAVKQLLEHLLAGTQYALGDLKADDSPSVKAGTK